jgi:hypothetical protein
MSDDFRQNYERFIDEVIELEIVWNLKSKDGFALCESAEFDEAQVMPFWSSEKEAKLACSDDWSAYQPNPVDIDDFIDAWLHGMDDDGIYVGVNWNDELEGAEIEPVIIIEDLLGEE